MLQNEVLVPVPIGPLAVLRRPAAARNTFTVHACDRISSKAYWTSSGLPVGVGAVGRCAETVRCRGGPVG